MLPEPPLSDRLLPEPAQIEPLQLGPAQIGPAQIGPAQPGGSLPARAGTQTDTESQTDTSTRLDAGWNVVVWDDPINLMNYVVYVFQKLFGFGHDQATKHMLEVHNEGRSVVATTHRERAEFYVTRLHAYGLQATMERSSE